MLWEQQKQTNKKPPQIKTAKPKNVFFEKNKWNTQNSGKSIKKKELEYTTSRIRKECNHINREKWLLWAINVISWFRRGQPIGAILMGEIESD